MEFFDCNCSYGVPSHPAFRFARTPAELLEEIDRTTEAMKETILEANETIVWRN